MLDGQPIIPDACLFSEEACTDYLTQLKWPNGFSCPHCYYTQAYITRTRRLPLYECVNCRHQTSLTAGTVMEGSRTSLTKWFIALKLVSNPHQGISALALSRIIAVTYKTAWTMLHKIRYALGQAEASTQLEGSVILNDAWYGKPYNPSVELHTQETPLLIGAVMAQDQPVRIAISMVPPQHLSNRLIIPAATTAFIRKHVSSSSSVKDIQVKPYTPIKLKKARPLFRLATYWINSTFHGLGKKHLQAYLDEFCCRTNMRLASIPIFEGISRLCTMFGTIRYSALIHRKLFS